MFTIHSGDPASILHVIRERIDRYIAVDKEHPLHESEIECWEDEVVPAIEKYLEIADKVFEEKEYNNV
jgi:hypothetical protein